MRPSAMLAGAVNGLRERIERIQVEINRKNLAGRLIIRSIRYGNPLTAFPQLNIPTGSR